MTLTTVATSDSMQQDKTGWRILLWVARLGAIAAIIPVLLILVGEPGTGPAGIREWVYLALFPIGFSIGYLVGWRWPVFGGCLSLACMVVSLIVIGRTFGLSAYLYWGILSVPGILYVIAGWKLRMKSN
jgi:hypothetical protein